MALPNSFGDFATGLEFGANRVAVRRSEGARSKAVRRPEAAQAPREEGQAKQPHDAER